MGLTGVLADQAADRGEGVVLPDQAHRVGAAALAHQGDVAGDVHVGGAALHAGHGLEIGGAVALADVRQVIVLEGIQAVQHQVGRLEADGAVGGIGDDLSSLPQDEQVVRFGVALQNAVQDHRQLVQTHAAGGAFSAALGETQLEEGGGQIHRTVALGARRHAAVQIGVKIVHGGLGHVRFGNS